MAYATKDYQEYYEERAAIYEFDGGLSRKEAEARARIDKQKKIERDLEQQSKGKHGKL